MVATNYTTIMSFKQKNIIQNAEEANPTKNMPVMQPLGINSLYLHSLCFYHDIDVKLTKTGGFNYNREYTNVTAAFAGHYTCTGEESYFIALKYTWACIVNTDAWTIQHAYTIRFWVLTQVNVPVYNKLNSWPGPP